jgi:hypothetical protein
MMNLTAYLTHGRDRATFKNIPMTLFETVRKEMTRLKRERTGRLGACTRIRYRFRGPRIGTGRRHTLKQDAHSFAVYLDYQKVWL